MRWLGMALLAAQAACTPESGGEPDAPARAPAPSDHESPSPAAQPVLSGPAAHGFPVQSLSLAASDGTEIFADLYAIEQDKPRPLILLFHQAGSNAGEYATIAPHLQSLGYNALAIDQRSGGQRWERENRTVARLGKSTSYSNAYPDLEAALAWAQREGFPRVIVWGSSYSAALVFRLANEHASDVHAVLAFSPGEYIEGQNGVVAGWASGVSAPIFVTSAPGEEVEAARAILAASPSSTKRQHEPAAGVHGASTLREDTNADGAADNWSAVEAFLRGVAP